MPEQLLTILKVCLLVLLYLFFLRVLSAVWAEVATADGSGATGRKRASPRRARRTADAPSRHGPETTALCVQEPPELAGTMFQLASVTTIGRAAGSTVQLEDSFLSHHHARIRHTEGAWYLEDLGSTNGTYLNRSKVDAASLVHPGDQIQVGNVVMEVR